ncbi:MAG: type II toxin-antitoxin system PemK/MazF family toxin [Caldilineaceae bacterium]|nr:type II toxin-antitoxin system PemK/MazF family toxin [Caldilineaceae bacterium]
MEGPVKGDVVVLPFPFSDRSASKRRPALVLAKLSTHNDVILCMITSKTTSDVSAVTITDADFVNGGLPQDSNVRPNRLFTADASLIQRVAGRLSQEKLTAVIDQVIRILK